jgi:hypothetical protein
MQEKSKLRLIDTLWENTGQAYQDHAEMYRTTAGVGYVVLFKMDDGDEPCSYNNSKLDKLLELFGLKELDHVSLEYDFYEKELCLITSPALLEPEVSAPIIDAILGVISKKRIRKLFKAHDRTFKKLLNGEKTNQYSSTKE